jgi:hypothetical protein
VGLEERLNVMPLRQRGFRSEKNAQIRYLRTTFYRVKNDLFECLARDPYSGEWFAVANREGFVISRTVISLFSLSRLNEMLMSSDVVKT